MKAAEQAMPGGISGEHELTSCLAELRSGRLVPGGEREVGASLEDFAATLPEVFGTLDSACLERVSQRLTGEAGAGRFEELVLVSEESVHIIHALPERPDVVLLATGSALAPIGLVLSRVRVRAAAERDSA